MWDSEKRLIKACFLFVVFLATICAAQEERLDYWLPGLENMKKEELYVTNVIIKAEGGDVDAALGLGFHFYNILDVTNAVKYLTIAASRGSSLAQYQLGCIFWSDTSRTNKNEQARYWLKMAMTNGTEWAYLSKERLGELDYEEGGGECLVSFKKAIEVVESILKYCTYIQYDTEQADAADQIRKEVGNIKSDRTVLRVLVILEYFEVESKNENSGKYRKYIDCGIDACVKKLSQTEIGKKMLEAKE